MSCQLCLLYIVFRFSPPPLWSVLCSLVCVLTFPFFSRFILAFFFSFSFVLVVYYSFLYDLDFPALAVCLFFNKYIGLLLLPPSPVFGSLPTWYPNSWREQSIEEILWVKKWRRVSPLCKSCINLVRISSPDHLQHPLANSTNANSLSACNRFKDPSCGCLDDFS